VQAYYRSVLAILMLALDFALETKRGYEGEPSRSDD
jgi:hypothetical protein